MATQRAVAGQQRAQREIMKHIQYLNLLELQPSSLDPTIPFYNDFHLLKLDESLSDAEIAVKAKGEANNRAYRVDKIGQAQNHRLDVALRNTINQAGLRFDSKPQAVAEHRGELHRHRVGRLVEIAKELCDRGNWTKAEAEEILEPIALSLQVQPSSLRKAVAEAIARAGVWPHSGQTGRTPGTSPPTPPHYLFKEFSVGRLRMPRLLAMMLPMGLVMSMTALWAGIGYSLILLALVLGVGTFERSFDSALRDRYTKWFLANVVLSALVLASVWIRDVGDRQGMIVPLSPTVGEAPRGVPLSSTFLLPTSARVAPQSGQGPKTLRYAADGDTKTAFLTAAGGGWIELDYGSPVKIAGIVVLTASQRSQCAGIRQASLSFDGRESQDIELADLDTWQVVALESHLATRVRIEVEEVYGAVEGSNACLNEIWFSAHTGFEPDGRWGGQWDTDWGRMSLQVQGNWVIGNYETERQGWGGWVRLRPQGESELEGLWCRGSSCAPPDSVGRLHLKLTENGQSFLGDYTEGFEQDMHDVSDEFEIAAYTIMGRRITQE